MSIMDRWGRPPILEAEPSKKPGSLFQISVNPIAAAHIAKVARSAKVRRDVWVQQFFDACYGEKFSKNGARAADVKSEPAPDCENCCKVNQLTAQVAHLEKEAKDATVARAAGEALNRAARQIAELKAALAAAETSVFRADGKIVGLGQAVAGLVRDLAEKDAALREAREDLARANAEAAEASELADALAKGLEETRAALRLAHADIQRARNAQSRMADELSAERGRRADAEQAMSEALVRFQAISMTPQQQADALPGSAVRAIKAWSASGMLPNEIARRAGISREAAKIILKLPLAPAKVRA